MGGMGVVLALLFYELHLLIKKNPLDLRQLDNKTFFCSTLMRIPEVLDVNFPLSHMMVSTKAMHQFNG